MSANTRISTQRRTARRRTHLVVDEALSLDAAELALTIRQGEGAEDELRWPLVGVRLMVRVGRDELVVIGGPAEARIRLLPVEIAYGRRWWMFACPGCGVRRRVLYLPYGRRDWACRRCHRLVARRVPHADVLRIAAEVDRLQGKVRQLQYLHGMREGPVIGVEAAADDAPDAKTLRREVKAMREVVDRLMPPTGPTP